MMISTRYVGQIEKVLTFYLQDQMIALWKFGIAEHLEVAVNLQEFLLDIKKVSHMLLAKETVYI